MKTIIKEDDNNIEDILELQGFALIVLGYLKHFCSKRKLPLVLTNILNKYPESISDTHPEGRAFDVSLNRWSDDDIGACIKFLEEHCMVFAPISLRTRKLRLTYRHNVGRGDHLHIQTKREI